jgi:hypothetical protein
MSTALFTIVMFLIVIAPLMLIFFGILHFYRTMTQPGPVDDGPDLVPETKTCRYCGRVLMQEWTHCPFCGREAEPPLRPVQ